MVKLREITNAGSLTLGNMDHRSLLFHTGTAKIECRVPPQQDNFELRCHFVVHGSLHIAENMKILVTIKRIIRCG